jgi:ABC-2 type transport system permease protein
VLETDAKVNGGFDMQSFRSTPEWRIITELKKQYDVQTVSAASPIDDKKYDVLLAILPSSLNQNDLGNFVDYVRKGRPCLIFDDPFPATNPGLAPRQPKPRPGGGMMGMGGGPPEPKGDGGKATSLVNLLGIQWVFDQVVWSNTITILHPEFADVVRPEMVAISRKSGVANAFHPDSEITKGLQEVLLFFSGTIQQRQNSQLKFTPLMLTGEDSGLINWDDFVDTSMSMFGGINVVENPPRRRDEYAHVVAAEIRGDGKDGGEKVNVIYCADIDLISDWFFFVRERRMYGLDLDNVTFVLNAVDHLAGDGAYIALRSRRPKHRTLTAVERETGKFIEESAKEREKANEDAKQRLEAAKQRLKEKVEKIRNDSSLDEGSKAQQMLIAQEEENRRLEVEQATIDQEKQKKIDEIRARTERQVRAVENRFFLWATSIPAIPAIVLGLIVWLTRLQNEQKEVPPSRRASGR